MRKILLFSLLPAATAGPLGQGRRQISELHGKGYRQENTPNRGLGDPAFRQLGSCALGLTVSAGRKSGTGG